AVRNQANDPHVPGRTTCPALSQSGFGEGGHEARLQVWPKCRANVRTGFGRRDRRCCWAVVPPIPSLFARTCCVCQLLPKTCLRELPKLVGKLFPFRFEFARTTVRPSILDEARSSTSSWTGSECSSALAARVSRPSA